jgi:uncharacterized RDD family membrane protein YckC
MKSAGAVVGLPARPPIPRRCPEGSHRVYDWQHLPRCICSSAVPAAIESPAPRTSGLRVPSAAQNVTVIQTCTQCGAINGAEARACCFCDARLSEEHTEKTLPTGVSTATEGNLAIAPSWRSEVTHRLDAYRTRRRHLRADPAQPEFAFDPPESLGQTTSESRRETLAPPEPAPAIQSWRYRPVRVDRMEIDVAQPAIDFEAAEQSSKGSGLPAIPHDALTLVAPLAERRLAGLMDAALLLFAYGGFLALFAVLGGRFTISKFGAVVTAATLGLFYAQYFVLFTFFGGATPGMMLRKLRVVSYDGAEPAPRQLLWRSFGYLVSAGTVMLGFVWALWDEDNLSWHDRISQTYLTLDRSQSSEDPGDAI